MGITAWCDIGGLQKKLLLGANNVGQEALIRFYLLHVIVLPLMTTILIGLHMWRIRKDGGLTRPPSEDEENEKKNNCENDNEVGEQTPPADTPSVSPGKTYGLMALVPGRTPVVDRVMANTIPTWPGALYAVAALSMLTLAVMLALGFFFDAPLAELANPAVPENPAKAPWYFLGLQEMVSYSAFTGGIAIPAIVVLGLMMVPYLDREQNDIGVWFGGARGRITCLASSIFASVVVIGMLYFTVNMGWLRKWNPETPQVIITFFNPGTVILIACMIWSMLVTKVTNSTRLGALAMFCCFLVGFVILTYFATVHRGPNWEFFWSQSEWPVH